MVDSNLARNRNDDPDFFADGDPLAELARIVGYDDSLVPKATTAPVRQEPAFNLEDELLQEFEQYDAPRPYQSAQPVADNDAAPLGLGVSPAAEDGWTDARTEPQFEETAAPQGGGAAPMADGSFGADEHAHGGEVDTADPAGSGSSVDPAAELPFTEWDALQPEALEPQAPALDVEAETDTAFASPVAHDLPPEEVALYEPEFDLADEIESAVAASVEADDVIQERPVEAPKKSGAYTPGFRMPLANFNALREPLQPVSQVRDEPVAALPEPVASAPVEDAAPTAVEQETLADTGWSRPEATGEIDPPTNAVQQSPVSLAPVSPAGSAYSAMDDLISDVQRFPLPQSARWTQLSPAQERAAQETVPASAPITLPVAGPVSAAPVPTAAAVPPKPVAKPGSAFDGDAMIDEEFELALDDLELDLSDIMADEDFGRIAEPKPAAVPAPAPEKPAPPVFSNWPQYPAAPPLSAFMVETQAPQASVPTAAKVEPAAAAGEATAPLPFDSSLITETDEPLEAIADLDVPELPVDEPKQAPTHNAHDDFDFDGELATLLQEPVSDGDEAAAEDAPAKGETSADPARPLAYTDLDEFERVLEQDFRRSLASPLPPRTDVSDTPPAGASGRRLRSGAAFAVPLAIAGVVIVGGSLAYLLFGGTGSSVASNGEPIVIAADSEPVKVLPENPGGKTVPNQDKAVYDRVAGAAPEMPTQETLISTSEEPIDVVQKTLMTDTLPLEGEYADEAVSDVPASMTEERLLPEEEPTVAATGSEQPVAVMPRRVKTMIVRPDGTLVEQEVPAPAAPVVATPAPVETAPVETAPVEMAKAPATPANTVELASVPAGADSAVQSGTAGIVPVSTDPLSPVGDNAAETVEAPAAEASSVNAPVPTARPAAQPVNIVASVSDQGNVRVSGETPAAAPAPEAAAPAPQQVAAVPPGGYVIQIASLPSQADAQKSYQNLSAKFGSIIGGRGVDIKQAEIAGKGTFYRVRIPAGSKADAVALCEKYRAAGGSCLVAR